MGTKQEADVFTPNYTRIPPPVAFDYSRWRHGGWYVHNIRYPGGGCGCVSNNFTDGLGDFADLPVGFSTRHDAALAEWYRVEALKAVAEAKGKQS